MRLESTNVTTRSPTANGGLGGWGGGFGLEVDVVLLVVLELTVAVVPGAVAPADATVGGADALG